MAEVEDEHGAVVELTILGDRPLDRQSEALAAAAREALRNAARHAPGAPVFVFAQAGPDGAEVFVRDEGPGFDLATVPTERRGVRDSIVGRMAAAGGTAAVESRPARAPRSRCASASWTRREPRCGSSSSTTTTSSAPACAPSSPPITTSSARPARRAEALAVIAATRPDVVLLDVHLPDGGGVAVLEALAAIARRRRACSRSRSPTPPRTSCR